MSAPRKIFMLSASDFKPGHCSICGQAALIKWRDAALGWAYGQCCIEGAVFADMALSLPNLGIRHPSIEEGKAISGGRQQ